MNQDKIAAELNEEEFRRLMIPDAEGEAAMVESIAQELIEAANKVHRETLEIEHHIEVAHLLELLHEQEDENH